jgi:hypothetical protein
MALVKGANGIVFDSVSSIASGLVGGGHAVYVDEAGEPSDVPVELVDEVDEAGEPSKDTKVAKG